MDQLRIWPTLNLCFGQSHPVVAQAPGGGSIGTYKELCALATDLGQPELVYRFMVRITRLFPCTWYNEQSHKQVSAGFCP